MKGECEMKGDLFDNCSTIIIGKNASKTGRVILGHQEDDVDSFAQLRLVPRMKHKEGEVLVFDDADAVIPQVPETWAYYWSEVRSPSGESFADGFVNEWGVAVVSNSCAASKLSDDDPQPKGMGYALRRLIAERARTAREGVEIAGELMTKYGYKAARAYTIADKDEGWVFMATTGPNYVAQRVGDDEVMYIPNWYTIRDVDLNDRDHERFYFSDTLVDYPLRHGWYKPAREGDYSDFDFSEAYITDISFSPSNMERSEIAWKELMGRDIPYRTFSLKAEKKYGIEDIKKVLRLHYKGWEDDLKEDPRMSPHRFGICRDTTCESLVVEFADEADLTCTWRATLRPCSNPYTPIYLGTLELPESYSWINVKAAQRSHLTPDADDLAYHPDRAPSAFHMLQSIMEFDYSYCTPIVSAGIAELESEWARTKPEVDRIYMSLKDLNRNYARRILTDYTCSALTRSYKWALEMSDRLVTKKDKDNMNFWRSKL